jgi:exonuclease 3'-5' domain-containing protein 1
MLSRGSGLASWRLAKEKGERLLVPEYGGSHDVFRQRPIPEDLVSCCVADVQYLPELWEKFWAGQAYRWRDLVNGESEKRVTMSQRSDYEPYGPNDKIAP